jgi:autotransporter-associated beta strand protein
LLDRATPGVDVTHQMSTSPTGGLGGTTASINFTRGSNVTGTATAYFDRLNMSGGGGGAILVNPQEGTRVIIGTSAKGANNVSQTLHLGGVTSGNEVTGAISNGAATGANSISVTKSNTSAWTLSGANTYTGATTVTDGTLIVNGSILGSTTTVNGGTLAGTGTLSAVIVNDAGMIAPGGNGIGTLSTGDLTLNDTADLKLEINVAGAGSVTTDLLLANNLILGFGNNAALAIANLGGNITLDAGTVITFLDYADFGWNGGTFAGLPDDTTFVLDANHFRISYNGADDATSAVVLVAVPEPGVAALLIGGAWMFGLRRQRRRASENPDNFDRNI